MRKALPACLAVLALTGCSSANSDGGDPNVAPRGTQVTTAKVTKQDVTNTVSLTGKVSLQPIFGLTAPVDGELRYADVQPQATAPTTATRVATVWSQGVAHAVTIPAGSTYAGRLLADRSKVTAGMPIVSAKYGGYGVVADIDVDQAYRLSAAVTGVTAQIKGGPGPFACGVLGTIAALPAGTVPAPAPAPKPETRPEPSGAPSPGSNNDRPATSPSEPTGLRLVCTGPAEVQMINGAGVGLEVTTDKAAGAIVAPVEAVAGLKGAGKVDVVGPDGKKTTKDVQLGITDGKVVVITSGLTGDETLAVPGPNVPMPAPNGR
ncbi:efflux RND transporter periplasmic adaptor subunit [Pseudonocardiaceae bacterium YIM PH 21723]|nr:efflux RND transporter periplasmic adaptor subunit [Pseudonocardiaceae bacterium YIM PH 21723]